jgi:hypothetical protein
LNLESLELMDVGNISWGSTHHRQQLPLAFYAGPLGTGTKKKAGAWQGRRYYLYEINK